METVDETIDRIRKEADVLRLEITTELNEYPWFASLDKFTREQIIYQCMRYEVKGEQVGFAKGYKPMFA